MGLYRVKAGKNFSASLLGVVLRGLTGWHCRPSLSAQVVFGKGWMADNPHSIAENDDEEHLHKVFGLSDGIFHHESSARFAIKRVGSELKLFTYVYEHGQRIWREICPAHPGARYTLNIKRLAYGWAFTVNGPGVSVVRVHKFTNAENEQRISKIPRVFRKLYPYYSGMGPNGDDAPAPVDVDTHIKWL